MASPFPASGPDRSAEAGGLGAAASRFLWLLPSLLLAWLCLRAAELLAGIPAGATASAAIRVTATALAVDALAALRYLPLLFLCSLPFLLIRSRRGMFWGLGTAWSLLLVFQAALIQFFLTARAPLGADLFAYSWRDIDQTASAGVRLAPSLVVATLLALSCLWLLLAWLIQHQRLRPPPRVTALLFLPALAAMAWLPGLPAQARFETEDDYNLSLSKAAFFFDDNIAFLMRSRPTQVATAVARADPASSSPLVGFHYLDPNFPFLRAEQTPDGLGPHFIVQADTPPNLVFILVEGLGRSFSGPDAALGSFTPFLDELAGQSLYWQNFLAVQGRTFAALPSIFGSLPFAEKGFNALGEAMPAHATLLSILKGQGYRLNFYGGFDLDFDNERSFLRRQGVDVLLGKDDFGPGYVRSPGSNSWGYADNELVSLALSDAARNGRQPFVSVLQTMTTHTPYTFPDQQRYYGRFEQRLDQLGLSDREKDKRRAYRDIYSSILYVDDALRRYFAEARKLPAYQNTIFIVTGDHRLPEIPMSTWIDRYHVPLLIYSPLLRAPVSIKSVSSDFDIAPSLLALLSHQYGIRTPRAVTWVGTGLDLEPSFRSLHDFPLKQTKTNLVDFVSGPFFLSRDTLYTLGDGMDIEPSSDAAALARVQARFAAFRAANDKFSRTLALFPAGGTEQLAGFQERAQLPPGTVSASTPALSVREVRLPGQARAGQLAIDVVFANTGPAPSGEFVPLVVLSSAAGRELSESYGAPLTLAAGQVITRRLAVTSTGAPPGNYFLSVLASQPQTGKRLGAGRYRIPIRIDD